MCVLKSICNIIGVIALLIIIFSLAVNLLLFFCPEEYCLPYTDEIIYQISFFIPYDIYIYFTEKRTLHNIFNIDAIESDHVDQITPKYLYRSEDVDGFFVYYMNTSQSYSETTIVFDNQHSVFNEVLCTYCTLQQYIRNKNLHMVHLAGIPLKIHHMITTASSLDKICLETFNSLDREHCPKKTFMANSINISNNFVPDRVDSFWKPKYVNLDCKRIIDGDKEYINSVKNNRIKYKTENLPMDCNSIKKRSFNIEDFSQNAHKRKYSLAFAYNVYKNYELLERRLSSQYSPRNFYCFAVDIKSPNVYKLFEKLAKCIPNVFVTKKQYNMTSLGDYASFAHLECMKVLITKKWDYIYLQQNDDFPLKTTKQQLEILEAMSFPVEMSFVDPSSTVPHRYNTSDSWYYKDLNFFLKGDKRRDDPNIMLEKIVFQKGGVCAGLPRESVEYIVKKINVTTFFKKLNNGIYGHDELSWQTLFTDENLKIPGSVPRKCVHIYHPRETYLARKVIWAPQNCSTKMYHHSVCTWGTEMLPELDSFPDFYGYRFRGDIDYGAEVCWMEHIYNRTHFMRHQKRDLWYYYNLPQSVYQRLSIKNDVEAIRLCVV